MRIKFNKTKLPEDFNDMYEVYSYIDEGPSWNRVIEVRRDIYALRSPTYVVEYGAPNYWGNRQIVSIAKYVHVENF